MNEATKIQGFDTLLTLNYQSLNRATTSDSLLRLAVANLAVTVVQSDTQSLYLNKTVLLLGKQIEVLNRQLREAKEMQQRQISVASLQNRIAINELYSTVKNWYPDAQLRQLRINNDTVMRDSTFRLRIINDAYTVLKSGSKNEFLLSNAVLTAKWTKALGAITFLNKQFLDASALFSKRGSRTNAPGIAKIYSFSVYMGFERNLTYLSELKQETMDYIFKVTPEIKYQDSSSLYLPEAN